MMIWRARWPPPGAAWAFPLALAAAATAAGFFSFLPTTYTGVAELGKVAGIGMIVAFLLSITMLPALLMLLNPPGEDEDVGFRSLGRLDDFMTRHRRNVIRIAAAAGVVSLGLMAFVQFDSNPLDLRSPKVESVSTLLDLMKNPITSPNTIDVPALSLTDADSVAARIAQEPLVGQTITLSSFVPEQQKEKLALIADANNLLDATLNPFEVAPPPTDAERVAAFKSTAEKLRAAAGNAQDKPAQGCPPPGRCAGCRGQGWSWRLGPGPRGPGAGPEDHAEPGLGFAEGRARHRRHHARRSALGLGGGRRHRPHPGLPQGHQQRSRRLVGLFRPGAERGAAGHRRTHLHPRIRQDHRGRLSSKPASCRSSSSSSCCRWCCGASMTC